MSANQLPLRKHFVEIDSTNRAALEWEGAPPFSVVSADLQTSGRGRLGRSWLSPSGKGLYFSVVNPPIDEGLASLLSGLAVANALEQITSLTVRCKWPNDIICRGFKIGGILCESKNGIFVVGIGINLTHELEDLPERAVFPASSLKILGASPISSEDLLTIVLQNLQVTFDLPSEIALANYQEKMYGVGEVVKVGKLIGVLQGVDSSGYLLLKTTDGLKSIIAGDVEFFAS
jgi:BirA family biotin operon repressor/biotin-[acetyl-CoA-carboxylase] ligase